MRVTPLLLAVLIPIAAVAADAPPTVQPAELASMLKSGEKPLMIQVGFRVLYTQAHIPGSEYIGPASKPEALPQLRHRLEPLPRTQAIVLYCGCCPWERCPNVNPAWEALHAMAVTSVEVLYIAHNFGKDWVDQGYPVATGEH